MPERDPVDLSLILTSKHNRKPAPHANKGTQNNSHIHGQSHTSRIENLSPSLADPSENSDDNIQVKSDSGYAMAPSKKRSQQQMQAGQAKENSTLNQPTSATPSSHAEDDTTPPEDPPWKWRKPHGVWHPHCLSFPARLKIDCVADHLDIRGTSSLWWPFLRLANPVHYEHQSLISYFITCAFCITKDKHSPKLF